MRCYRLYVAALSVCALSLALSCARAQSPAPDRVAILPWVFELGTSGAQASAKGFLSAVLLKARLEELPQARTTLMWEDGMGKKHDAKRATLPKSAELLKLGQKLDVDWVIAGRAKWHTRSLWVGMGPKTKSDCTVDMLIVDVRKQVVALDAKAVKMDSTAKENTLKAVGAIVLTPLFTVVSGGPKTPHEQRAVQLAIAKAIQPWLATRVESAHKIDADDK